MKARQWEELAEGLMAWQESRSEILLLGTEMGADDAGPFMAAVDESPFQLDQWAGALILLREWLSEHGLEMAPADRVAYVGCAASSVETASALTDLPELVRDYLGAYGCDRARPIDRRNS